MSAPRYVPIFTMQGRCEGKAWDSEGFFECKGELSLGDAFSEERGMMLSCVNACKQRP